MAIVTLFTCISLDTEGTSVTSPAGGHGAEHRQMQETRGGCEDGNGGRVGGLGEGMAFKVLQEARIRRQTPSTKVLNAMTAFS